MTDNTTSQQLLLFIERLERLGEEKKGIADDMKDVFGEAKAHGFDTKTMRYVLRERAKAKEVRDEERALQEEYLAALGLL